jgi:3-dehydroquinate dehydratase-1
MARLPLPTRPGCIRVGVVATPAGLRLLSRVRVPCEIVELRLDRLLASGVTGTRLVEALSRRRHPVLATLRSHREGGALMMNDAQRAALVRALLPVVDALDVEHAARTAFASVLRAARAGGVPVVLSAHYFDRAPAPATLARRLAAMRRARPAIAKIAAHAGTLVELGNLLRLQASAPAGCVALMGMGPFAAPSRQLLPLLGARLVYGWLDEPTAPGQPSARDLPTV